MEAVSDSSSQTEQNCTLLITSYFPNYIYENGTIYWPTTTTTREEGTEEEEE